MSPITEQIQEKFDIAFRPANESEIAALKEIGAPSSLLDHFSKYAFDGFMAGWVTLCGVDEMIEMNTQAVPGCGTAPHGVYVIATTLSGDAYCLDTNSLDSEGRLRVVFASHEVIGEDAPRDYVMESIVSFADNYELFLKKLAADEVPDYL